MSVDVSKNVQELQEHITAICQKVERHVEEIKVIDYKRNLTKWCKSVYYYDEHSMSSITTTNK